MISYLDIIQNKISFLEENLPKYNGQYKEIYKRELRNLKQIRYRIRKKEEKENQKLSRETGGIT